MWLICIMVLSALKLHDSETVGALQPGLLMKGLIVYYIKGGSTVP